MQKRAFISVVSAALCAAATQAAAHTNSVGFQITPSAVTTCVGSGGSECYDVEVFLGSWHSGTLPPQGNLALFQQTGSGEVQVVGPSAGSSTPFSMSHSLLATIPNSGSTTYNYAVQGSADQANLLSVFTAGSDYFFTSGTSATTLSSASTGSLGIYSHQSATGVGLPPGTYRIAYDTIGFPTSATWTPVAAIATATFTISSGGGVVVDTGGAPNVVLSAPSAPTGPFTVTATFSEAVTGVDLADFVIAGGTASNLVQVAPNTYTVLVTPTGSGPVNIDMPADSAIDTDTNGNTASNTLSVAVAAPPAPSGLTSAQQAEIVNTAMTEELKTLRSQLATDRRMVRAARERFLAAQRCRADLDDERRIEEQLECDELATRQTPLGFDGLASVTQNRSILTGTFFEEMPDGPEGRRRLVFGDFDVVYDEDLGVTVALEGRIAWERMTSDSSMVGYFVGGQLARSDINTTYTGDRDRIGVAAGVYGVRDTGSNLTLDGFLTAGFGFNDLSMTNGTLDVEGDYMTTSLQFGVAVSGKREYSSFDLLPELAFFGGYSDLGDLSIDATAIGFSSSTDLDAGYVAFGVISLTPEFVFPATFDGAWPLGEYRLAPSLLCETVRSSTRDTNCGGALEFELSAQSGNGLNEFSLRLRTERVGDSARHSASLMLEHQF